MNIPDLIGSKFGKGTVIKHIGFHTTGKKTIINSPLFEMMCDCGERYNAS